MIYEAFLEERSGLEEEEDWGRVFASVATSLLEAEVPN